MSLKNDFPSQLNTEQQVPGTDLGAQKPWQAANPQGLEPVSQTIRDSDATEPRASASDTLGGATSGDVHTGIGKPLGGETSSELHHNGQHHRKKQGGGVEQFGVQAGAQGNINRKDEFQDIKELNN
ncbi:unnamed protein product [Peniophora sp. CBMAI 1063]|nr:unnamed protein product [Peniophora sp. CBMAI 1063]